MSRGLLCIALLLTGCGGASYPKTIPVTGKVLVNGQPAAKATVVFFPQEAPVDAVKPMAVVEADGTFRPSTFKAGDGAPPGKYLVTVIWPKIRIDHGEEIPGPDQLHGAYGSPSPTGLSVTIAEGQTELPPFQLKR